MEATIGLLIRHIRQQLSDSAYSVGEIRAITHIIFQHYANINPADLYISFDKQLSNKIECEINSALLQLKEQRPLQYIIGKTEFYGLPFLINENVLIPRPETEELVQWIIKDNEKKDSIIPILDIGTGSGAIAVALAKKIKKTEVYALDISVNALQLAKKNAQINNVSIQFINEDILAENRILPSKFACIVSNPPYVRNSEKAQMQANVLDYEPHVALFVEDTNPLIFYEAIAKVAEKYLLPDGAIYVEINEALPDETEMLFRQFGFKTMVRTDINEKPRMLKAWL